LNPYAPQTPGAPGKLNIGWGSEKAFSIIGKVVPVIGEVSVGDKLLHSYLGHYKLSRGVPLGAEEWRSRTPKVRLSYIYYLHHLTFTDSVQ
jgi:hypothetical protein